MSDHDNGSEDTMSDDKLPPPQAWPVLRARDARAMIRFLVEAFGFEETVVYGDGDTVHHAELAWPPGGGIMLGSAPDPAGPAPEQGSFGVYLVTGDVDGAFARAQGAGAAVLAAPHDTDYGSREFAAADPEGNRWTFGSYRGAPRS